MSLSPFWSGIGRIASEFWLIQPFLWPAGAVLGAETKKMKKNEKKCKKNVLDHDEKYNMLL
jgi:hypothetical protein